MNGHNHIGCVFGRLTVIAEAPRKKQGGYRYWSCSCECGETVVVNGHDLRRDTTTSCGCLGRERASEANRKRLTTHGLSRTYFHVTWQNMLSRCRNPNNSRYANYGGRGIDVCPEWVESLEAFARDMGERPSPKHSLDRINVDGNYEPGNCRWATNLQQARNRTDSKVYEFDGVLMNVYEAAEKYDIPRNTLDHRLRRGVPPARAVLRKRISPAEAFAEWEAS